MVPVGIVAEGVAIKPSVIEIVQAVEILRCELIVSKLVVSDLIVREFIVAKLIVGGEIVTGINCVIVIEIMGSELMSAAARGVTSKSMSVVGVRREAVGAQRMTASAVNAAISMETSGSAVNAAKSMESRGSAVNAAKSMDPASAKSMKPTTATAPAKSMKLTATTTAAAKPMKPAAPARPGDCRGVRHEAKRTHSDARCQNAYSFLLHDAFPTWMS